MAMADYKTAVAALSGIQNHWPLETDASDTITSFTDLIGSNSAVAATAPTHATGPDGASVVCLNNKVANRVLIPSALTLPKDNTVGYWINLTSQSAADMMAFEWATASFAKYSQHDIGYTGTSGNMAFSAFYGTVAGATGQQAARSNLPNSTWVFVCVVTDTSQAAAAQIKVYLNGSLLSTSNVGTPVAQTQTPGSGTLGILGRGQSSRSLPLDGAMCGVFITSALLSTGDMATLRDAMTKIAVPLGASSGVSSTSLALTAPTQVPLNTASAVATDSLALAIGASTIPLNASSGVSSASLALTAPTQVPLNAASAVASDSLALTAGASVVPLNSASGQASSSLALRAPTIAGLNPCSGQSSASLAITVPSDIGSMTASASEVSGGAAFLSTLRGPRISETFDERWSSGLHVGAAKPELRIEIRQGRFNRRRAPWNDGVYPIDATIGDLSPPWQAFWEPTTEYVEIPSVLSVELAKNFDQRGVSTAVISIENIVYTEATAGGEGGIYHLFHRGYMSPLRGYVADGRDALTDEHGTDLTTGNEWFNVLNRNYQITVHEGYGDEFVKVFTGLIDDVDVTSHPDKIIVNARCFGQTLVDSEMFGWNIDKDLRDPVTFIDRDEAENIKKGGYDPSSSSHQTGHDSDQVNDGDSDTYWASNDHTGAANTEWVEIKLAQGRYTDFWLGTKWANQDIYVSLFATQPGDGEFPTRNGTPLSPNDWVDIGAGTVPGGFGGVPYIRFIDHPNSATTQVRDLEDAPVEYVVGPDSILRISLRNLHDTGGGVYRAGVRSLYSRKRTLTPEAVAQKWILVGDVSDVVKVILRWAGFKDWNIESSGVRLNKRFLANRGMKYMDVIDKVKDSLGYEFFVADPVTGDDASLGIPTFRKSQVLTDAAPKITVTHEDLLTAIDFKATDEPLASIIRARGRESKTGNTLGGDKTKRIMYVYRPPWSGLGMGGLLKHVIHTNYLLKSNDDVKFAAWFIALQEALTSVVVGGEIPGYPGIDLDDLIVLMDLGTGLTTRLQIQERRSTFTAGEAARWTMSFSGAIVDVPDVQTIVGLVNDAVRDNG